MHQMFLIFFSAGEDFQSVEFAYKDEAGDKSVFCF